MGGEGSRREGLSSGEDFDSWKIAWRTILENVAEEDRRHEPNHTLPEIQTKRYVETTEKIAKSSEAVKRWEVLDGRRLRRKRSAKERDILKR